MKNIWFKRIGWFHAPMSVPGFVVVLGGMPFCLETFVAIDRHAHSASDTFYGIFPYSSGCFLLIEWVAGRTSDSANPRK